MLNFIYSICFFYVHCLSNVIPGPATSASAENLLEIHILVTKPDLLDQNFWGLDPEIGSSGDSNIHSSLRTIGLLNFYYFNYSEFIYSNYSELAETWFMFLDILEYIYIMSYFIPFLSSQLCF